MSAEAEKWGSKFSEGVVTALDSAGYPVSVRQTSLPYDAATGTMPLTMPEALDVVEGPASLLCHFHDEQLWNMSAIQLRGRIEKRDGKWLFVTTAFIPPSMLQLVKNVRAATRKYLADRGLVGDAAPVVNYAAIERLWVLVEQRNA